MLINPEFDKSFVANFFKIRGGWKIIKIPQSDVNFTETKSDEEMRCMDEREGKTRKGYVLGKAPLAPAWPGAVLGIAALFNGRSFADRLASAVGKINGLGIIPAVHGDTKHPIRGCAAVSALIEGKVPNLPQTTEAEAGHLIKRMGLRHRMLSGPHTAYGLIINTQPFSTIIPDGRHFIADVWLPWTVGVSAKSSLEAVVATTELLLPPRQRRLYLP